MKQLAIAGLVAVAVTAPPMTLAAHASGNTRGGCSLISADDPTIGGQLGGEGAFRGEVLLAAGATDGSSAIDPTRPISGACEIRINGVSQGVVAQATGTGVAIAASTVQYQASPTDVVELCTHTDVNGESSVECAQTTSEQEIPQPVVDLLFAIGDTVSPVLWGNLNPVICPVLATIARDVTTTNTLPVRIGPDGDVYLFGALAHDCAPYQS